MGLERDKRLILDQGEKEGLGGVTFEKGMNKSEKKKRVEKNPNFG